MKPRSLSHLADHALIKYLVDFLKQRRADTAVFLSILAEVDERKLYLPAGYSSMYLFCVHELHMSEDTALKRIRVAKGGSPVPRHL